MDGGPDRTRRGETLSEQFTRVKQETNKSHVQQFGDLTFAASEPTSNFQGNTDTTNSTRVSALIDAKKLNTAGQTTSLPSADAELASAYARFMATGSKTAAAELIAGVNDRLKADERFDKLAHAVMGRTFSRAIPDDLTSYNKCHYAAHKAYIAKCGEFTTGSLKHSATLMEMCVSTHGKEEPIVAAINECASCGRAGRIDCTSPVVGTHGHQNTRGGQRRCIGRVLARRHRPRHATCACGV